MNSLLLAIPGGASIALIVVAILLLFGGKKIPELMRGLGKGISEFKKGKNEIDNELNDTNENKEDN
jgi:sec-independent protein translocase protein TatA